MNDREPGPPASPPCFAHELDADGRHVGEADAAADVARRRRAERKRLTALRLALEPGARRRMGSGPATTSHLRTGR